MHDLRSAVRGLNLDAVQKIIDCVSERTQKDIIVYSQYLLSIKPDAACGAILDVLRKLIDSGEVIDYGKEIE
jgi:hypothetical protein